MTDERAGARGGGRPIEERAASRREQVEGVIRRGYAAFNSRDLDGMLDLFEPDADWDMSAWGTELGERFAGREAIRRYLEGMIKLWDDIEIRPEEVLPTDDPETFIVCVCVVVSSRGATVEGRYPNVITMHDDRATRFRAYTNLADALEAAGSREKE